MRSNEDAILKILSISFSDCLLFTAPAAAKPATSKLKHYTVSHYAPY